MGPAHVATGAGVTDYRCKRVVGVLLSSPSGVSYFPTFPPYKRMSLIQEKTTGAASGETMQFRLERNVQHFDFIMYRPLSVYMAGLLLGLPEVVSMEVENPNRERVRQVDEIPLSHIALWAQHGRGEIKEVAPATVRQKTDGETGALSASDAVAANLYRIRVRFYLNDNGAVEITPEDHWIVTIVGLVAHSKYQILAPELPVVPMTANSYTEFEPGIILESDRERIILCEGKSGIIMPNRPDVIQRILATFRRADGTTDTKEYALEDFLASQADVNPNILKLTYDSPDPLLRASLFMDSDTADLFVIDFKFFTKLQIDCVLGQRLHYSLVTQKARP